MNSAPFPAASSIAAITRSSVAAPDVRSGAICTAAARTFCFLAIAFSFGLAGRVRPASEASERPGVEDEGVVAAMQEHEVEHVERVDRPDALDQRRLTVPVKRLQREAAGIDFAALGDELRDLIVEVLSAWERFVADFGKAALDAEGDAWPVEQNGGLEAFALKAGRLKQVDEADRAFEGDRVERHEGLFPGLRLDVLENLFLIVDEGVAFLVGRMSDRWHRGLAFRLRAGPSAGAAGRGAMVVPSCLRSMLGSKAGESGQVCSQQSF